MFGIKEFCGKLIKLPTTLSLPTSDKFCMFEFGGSKFSSGVAMTIATPSGFPNSAIVLKQRKINGLHLCSRVWPNSLIGIAHHQYGITNIGIYRIKTIRKPQTDQELLFYPGNIAELELLVGVVQSLPDQVHDLRWLAPHDRKYPGLKKMTQVLLQKLESFDCILPMYFEPFRIIRKYSSKDPDFNKLMNNTDLTIDSNISDLVPQYVNIATNMSTLLEYHHYLRFENAILDVCQQVIRSNPFVYLLLCHHKSPGEFGTELLTHAFISYQENEGKKLMFHRTGYVYKHTGHECRQSTDFESFIKSNYNESYLHILLGVHGGGIPRLLDYIESSKDGCLYIPLKYSLCTRRYQHG